MKEEHHVITPISQGVIEIMNERTRQIEQEGWTTEHDDMHGAGEMAEAAACYALSINDGLGAGVPARWPWCARWWKPTTARRNLVKAGALIAAEIDRLDRMAEGTSQ